MSLFHWRLPRSVHLLLLLLPVNIARAGSLEVVATPAADERVLLLDVDRIVLVVDVKGVLRRRLRLNLLLGLALLELYVREE